MFYEVQMLCFRFFQLSYFADVDLLLPVPIWMPTPHHCRIGWYDFKPSLSGWNSWLLAGLVDERWRHWTGYFVIILLCKCCLLQSLWWKCCEIITGRSVSWYDSETHLRLVSPEPNIGMHHRSNTSHWWWSLKSIQNRHNETETTKFVYYS